MKPSQIGRLVVGLFLLSLALAVTASEPPASRLIPFDPTLEVSIHEYGDREAHDVVAIFPRHQVPQVRRIREPGALLMAITIRDLALLPGDRLVVRDASNDTILEVSASNQSAVKRALQRPRRFLLWNHPLLMFGNTVTLEYWPSLRTLVLPIDRPQLDNPVVAIDSYTFAFRRRRRRRPTFTKVKDGEADETNAAESTVGTTNEMKPAVCFKASRPEWYNKSRGIARLIIQRSANNSSSSRRDSPTATRFAVQDGVVGSDDPRDPQREPPTPAPRPASDVSYTFCTGWLIGRGNHMLTNYHCFYELTRRSDDVVPSLQATRTRPGNSNNTTDSPVPVNSTTLYPQRQVSVNFMAEAKSCNATSRLGERVSEIDATSVEILVANQALDYCLLKVLATTRNGSGDREEEDLAKKFGYLTLRARGPVDGEAIYIPQHPNGEPKTIAFTKDGKSAVIRVPDATSQTTSRPIDSLGDTSNISVRYNADTAPGSSGSPVISQRDNTVIALHHAGTGTGIRPRFSASTSSSDGWSSWLVDLLRGGGRDSASDSASTGSDDGSTTTTVSEDEWNVGIRIDAIVADLRKRRLLPPCAVAEKCGDNSTTNGTRVQAPKNKKKIKTTAPRSPCCDTAW